MCQEKKEYYRTLSNQIEIASSRNICLQTMQQNNVHQELLITIITSFDRRMSLSALIKEPSQRWSSPMPELSSPRLVLIGHHFKHAIIKSSLDRRVCLLASIFSTSSSINIITVKAIKIQLEQYHQLFIILAYPQSPTTLYYQNQHHCYNEVITTAKAEFFTESH